MSIRRFTLLVLAFLSLLFITSIALSSYYLQRSNASLNDVNREIRVVLSIVDTINHSRTLRVHLSQYIAYREQGKEDAAADSLKNAQRVMGLAEKSFSGYMAWPKLDKEAPLADNFNQRWQDYHDNALKPLMAVAQQGDRARFEQMITSQVPQLDRQFEISLDELLSYRESYARSLNETAQSNFRLSLTLLIIFTALFLLTMGAIAVLLKKRLLNAI